MERSTPRTTTFRPRSTALGAITVSPFVPDPGERRSVYMNGLWMAACADVAYVRAPLRAIRDRLDAVDRR